MIIFGRLKMRNYLVLFILLILLATSASAITATILSGMIQINLESVPVTLQKSIGVKNENNETVNVSIFPSDDIKDRVVMESYNFSLQPGEQRFIKFNLTITEMKEQRTDIKVVFSKPGSNNTEDRFGLATKLVIIPLSNTTTGNATQPPISGNQSIPANQTVGNTTSSNSSGISATQKDYLIYGIIGLVFVLFAGFIILKTKAGAKNE
jgi:hypothetical protein